MDHPIPNYTGGHKVPYLNQHHLSPSPRVHAGLVPITLIHLPPCQLLAFTLVARSTDLVVAMATQSPFVSQETYTDEDPEAIPPPPIHGVKYEPESELSKALNMYAKQYGYSLNVRSSKNNRRGAKQIIADVIEQQKGRKLAKIEYAKDPKLAHCGCGGATFYRHALILYRRIILHAPKDSLPAAEERIDRPGDLFSSMSRLFVAALQICENYLPSKSLLCRLRTRRVRRRQKHSNREVKPTLASSRTHQV